MPLSIRGLCSTCLLEPKRSRTRNQWAFFFLLLSLQIYSISCLKSPMVWCRKHYSIPSSQPLSDGETIVSREGNFVLFILHTNHNRVWCLYIYIYIYIYKYEMGLSYTLCNLTRVTPFVDRRFVIDLMVKKNSIKCY